MRIARTVDGQASPFNSLRSSWTPPAAKSRGVWRAACPHCAGDDVQRRQLLQLLGLVEHPEALPAELALRLATELLALADHGSAFRCEPIEETGP
jgi:hypothetical protein